MKALIFVVIVSASVSARANQLICNTGNGAYLVEYSLSAKLNAVQFTVVDASGVEDASGELACAGPEEAAYRCSGEIPALSGNGTFTGPKRYFDLTIAEAELQVGQGQIMVGINFVSCSSK